MIEWMSPLSCRSRARRKFRSTYFLFSRVIWELPPTRMCRFSFDIQSSTRGEYHPTPKLKRFVLSTHVRPAMAVTVQGKVRKCEILLNFTLLFV